MPYVYRYPWRREEGVIFPRTVVTALVTTIVTELWADQCECWEWMWVCWKNSKYTLLGHLSSLTFFLLNHFLIMLLKQIYFSFFGWTNTYLVLPTQTLLFSIPWSFIKQYLLKHSQWHVMMNNKPVTLQTLHPRRTYHISYSKHTHGLYCRILF